MLAKDFFNCLWKPVFVCFCARYCFGANMLQKWTRLTVNAFQVMKGQSSMREESRSWPARMASALLSMQERHPQIKPSTSFKGMGVASHHLSTQAQGFVGLKLTS